jgi:hypothetical protein
LRNLWREFHLSSRHLSQDGKSVLNPQPLDVAVPELLAELQEGAPGRMQSRGARRDTAWWVVRKTCRAFPHSSIPFHGIAQFNLYT